MIQKCCKDRDENIPITFKMGKKWLIIVNLPGVLSYSEEQL